MAIELNWASLRSVEIKQPNIIRKILSITGMLNLKPVVSPVDSPLTQNAAMKWEPLPPEHHSVYQSIIGSSIYFALNKDPIFALRLVWLVPMWPSPFASI